MATKWGIVSAGKISHDFVTALGTLPKEEHEVVAVAARKLENAQSFAKLHGIPLACDRYEDIARNPDVQVAYIGCINTHHFSLGKLMLENGKHVLMEKPLCLTLKECEALMNIAKEKKLFLMEAIWSRFIPSYEHLMKELKAGTAGDVMNVDCSLGYPMSYIDNLTKLSLGGGILLSVGIYCVNAIAMVYDHETPEKIVALGHLNEEGVDEGLSVCLQYSGGRLATFTTSCKVLLPNDVKISGTKGIFKIPDAMICPTEVHYGDRKVEFPLPPTKIPCVYPNSVGLRYEAMEVRRCLLQGLLESPRMSHEHTRHIHSVMAQICQQMGVDYSSVATVL